MKIRSLIILLVLGTAIGISLSNIFTGKEKLPAHITPHAPALQKRVKESATVFHSERESLDRQNKLLEGSRQMAQGVLKDAKQKSVRLHTQLSNISNIENDSSSYCNELQAISNDMIAVTEYQDSLHEVITDYFSSQLKNRDSLIQLIDAHSDYLQNTLDSSLSQELLLEKQLHTLTKQLRRKRFAGKLQSAGIIILAAFAAVKTIH